MCPEKIVIFGITGSIGTNSEKIISAFPDRFELIGASAGNNIELLNTIIKRHPSVEAVAIASGNDHSKISDFHGTVYSGEEELIRLLDLKPDKIVMALPGKQGWKITVEAVKRNIPVCLANKESLVIAGFYLGNKVTSDRSMIIPIDSEHAALMQLLENCDRSRINKVYITASGGALRNMSKDEMLEADAQKALAHPVWNMGKKVTVDSATMLNKGLELFEAFWLFNIDPGKLGVLVHPSVDVHAAIMFQDGSAVSQNAVGNMLVPIAAAMSYPEMLPVVGKFPDMEFKFENREMKFSPPDLTKYPLLAKAFELLNKKDFSGMVAYAISDEIAVEKFLKNEITVKGIHEIVAKSVEKFAGRLAPSSINKIEEFIDEIEEFAREVL
ncbi:MAG: hypothetical protein RBT87_07585 [bacterium]|jgi:1-deoxy-D-xylulose-5-phosphate reductoisomerase|nr:hypothetical protein [bacterium]